MTAIARWLVAISLFAGFFYPALWFLPLPPAAILGLKGAGVGLLALAAIVFGREPDDWLLAALLAFGASGDVLLEIEVRAGVAAFAAGHVVAIALYWRNRRSGLRPWDWSKAALLPILAATIPALLLRGRPEAAPFAAYGLLLGAMAASASLSRFLRTVVIGALLFLASDMLIALRMASGETWLGLPIWLLYYIGQLMIFLGVRASLPTADRSHGGPALGVQA